MKDKYGRLRDVVLGYDDTSLWQTDSNHPVFGSIVGRYANRIANGTFSIPISKNPDPNSPNTYHIYANGPNGAYTLHGGKIGWDRRNWTLAARTTNSLTFSHFDAGDENFPGNVSVKVVYTLLPGAKYDVAITATATQKTPLMLTSHIYWNLDAFQESANILDHRLRVAASKVIEGDAFLVPTGNFINVQGTSLDFRSVHPVGYKWNETAGYGGCPTCLGYDNPWVFDNPNNPAPNLSIYSANSGIRLDITSNQPVVQVYTGNWLAIPRKAVHGGPNLTYDAFSAIAIEPEGYVDAINNPAWGVDQIYHPGRNFNWKTTYQFSIVK